MRESPFVAAACFACADVIARPQRSGLAGRLPFDLPPEVAWQNWYDVPVGGGLNLP
jgi:hypothetical protein